MDIRITKPPTGGRVEAIPSKSAAHRILIAAAVTGIELAPYCDGLSRDITATKDCLTVLTGKNTKIEDRTMAQGAGNVQESNEPAALFCGESGSTLRFLIPLAGVLGIDADFICEGRLPDRPMEPFLRVLAEHGCQVSGRDPKQLRGKLSGGDFQLPGNISSQYVTGLLMALPLADAGSRIIVEGTLQSRPYIDLTLEILAKAGIEITESNGDHSTVFIVPGRQKYDLPASELEHIEGDWSNAAFWLVMDAMLRGLQSGTAEGSNTILSCEGLDPASVQGDRAIVQVIRQIESADDILLWGTAQGGRTGCDTSVTGRTGCDISVTGRAGFVEIDVSDIPDLVPIISAFACARPQGALTHITGAERLRFKESDRLQAVTEVLTGLGADVTEEPAGLMIRGTGTLRGGDISSFGDHRIAMMAAACSCIAKEDIIIRGAEAVEKSYPGFFTDFQTLGGKVEEVNLVTA